MEKGVGSGFGHGIALRAVRAQAVKQRPSRSPGALVRVGAHKNRARRRTKRIRQQAVIEQHAAQIRPHGRDQSRPARRQVPALHRPVRPEAGAPGGQGFHVLGGRTHTVPGQSYYFEQPGVAVRDGSGCRGTEKKSAGQGEKKEMQGAHAVPPYRDCCTQHSRKAYGRQRHFGRLWKMRPCGLEMFMEKSYTNCLENVFFG